MKRTRKQHNVAFKAKVALTAITSECGVHPNQIYNWTKQLLDGAANVFVGEACSCR
jgi:transposase